MTRATQMVGERDRTTDRVIFRHELDQHARKSNMSCPTTELNELP